MISLILNSLFILTLIYLIWKWVAHKVLTQYGFLIVIIIKLFFAIFTCFYYVGGDIHIFQQDANHLTSIFWSNKPLYFNILFYDDYSLQEVEVRHSLYYWTKPRAFFMAKTISLLNIFTFNNIYFNAIYITLINIFSVLYLLLKIKKYNSNYFISSFIVLLLVPSVVFNTSGLEKEVLVMAAIYLIVAFGIAIYQKEISGVDFLLFVFGLFLIFKIKYYYLPILISLGGAFIVSSYFKNNYIKFTFAFVFIAILLYYAKFLHPYLHPELAFQSTIMANHELILKSRLGMNIPFQFTNYSLVEFVYNIPMAIVYGLFGPFFWEVKNLPMAYISLENFLVMILFGWFIYQFIKKKVSISYFGIMVFLYIISLTIILAFYSPNFGTLTRYKVSFYPFLLIFMVQQIIITHQKRASVLRLFVK